MRKYIPGHISRINTADEQGELLAVWFLRVFVSCGVLALLYYLSWWFFDGRLRSPGLVAVLLAALLYAVAQMAGNWLLYLFAHRTTPKKLSPGFTVDVFVTACHESYDFVERALAAACAMQGEHRTWLLDDGRDPALVGLACRLGAGYLARADNRDKKAGNLNAALARTDGEIVVIFDIDHVPRADFLEQSLGCFADPQVGFVQVMLTFANGDESWVAQAATETSLEFYNPTSLGANGLGGATLMGSNALIRRKALESIEGYRPGLAEDLATSIALHAAGWRSVYVAEPLAPGLAPHSFVAWFIQQLKWARGVFELLLTAYPRLFTRLTWGQRLSYAVRMTKYWIGPAVALHLFATIAVLILGSPAVWQAFNTYLVHLAPLILADVLIRMNAFLLYRHPATPRTSMLKAVVLVYATWPVYTLAWAMAVLRLPLSFRPTPKRDTGALHPAWLLPQAAVLLLLVGALLAVPAGRRPVSLLLLIAGGQAALQLIFIANWFYRDASNTSGTFPAGQGPVAVLDIEFNDLPTEVRGLERFHQAFLLVRLNGVPTGRLVSPVFEGRISGESLRRRILETAELPFWERWVQGYLKWEQPPMAVQSLPPVCVAVCTRDRPQDLRRCLEALDRMPDNGQELLVVDSCSASLETRGVVAAFPRARYVREDSLGLDRARNRAFLETSADIVAFMDDDSLPDPMWLPALVRNFQEPGVYAVTGLTMPFELETKAQQWFERYSTFSRGFWRKTFTRKELHPLAAGQVGAGANMALRRAAWEALGPFDEALDAGTPTRSGGDTEMFSRILGAGYQIVYDPAALAWHRHRRDWKDLRQALFGYGVGAYALWTRKLVAEGEWSVLALALEWACKVQLPGLLAALLHLPGSAPSGLLLAELLGCLVGPVAYLASRRETNRRRNFGYPPYHRASSGEYYYPYAQPQLLPGPNAALPGEKELSHHRF